MLKPKAAGTLPVNEAIRGTDLAKIQQRAGHTTTNTTLIYVRFADEVRGVGFGEVFPELPWIGSRIGSTIGSTGPERGAKTLRSRPLRRFGERDSNPHSGNQNPASCR